jgi:hypothetical protein
MAGHTHAQSDSIYIAKNFWGYKFYHQNERLNINQLPLLMEDNPEALDIMVKAKNRHVLSSIVSGAGGFLIGLQLANTIIGGEPNWTMAAIGGGLVIVSIPIYSKSYKLSSGAVNIHNSQLHASLPKSQLRFGISGSGFGMKCFF